MPQGPLFKEIGQTGLRRSGGVIIEEYLSELRGPLWHKVVREMLNDPVIASFLFAIEMLIRSVDWDVEPASDSPRDQENADFLKTALLEDMNQPWSETIAEILSFVPWGWSYMEVVYKRRRGEHKNPALRSAFSDNKIGFRKFAIRSQDSLQEWDFDEAGGVNGMIQSPPPDYNSYNIPIERALLFRTTTHKGNPEGQPLLRRVYRAYYFKHLYENLEGIGIERNLNGVPLMRIPSGCFAETASEAEKELLRYAENIVANMKRDEQSGLVLSSDRDANGHLRVEFELLSPSGSGQKEIDTDRAINRWDQRMLMVMMADFLLLGSSDVGSFALAASKSELFATALGALTDSICGVISRHAFPKLLRLNGRTDPAPKLTASRIQKVDLQLLGEFMKAMTAAGIVLTGEQGAWAARQAGMPVAEGEDQEMRSLTPPPPVAPNDGTSPDAPADEAADDTEPADAPANDEEGTKKPNGNDKGSNRTKGTNKTKGTRKTQIKGDRT